MKVRNQSLFTGMGQFLLILLVWIIATPVSAGFLELDQKKSGEMKDSSKQDRNLDPLDSGDYTPSLFQGDNFPEDLARNIRAASTSGTSVRISWEFKYPVGKRHYTLFRHTEPIDSLAKLEKSEVIGTFPADEVKIDDQGLPKGLYFYAVVEKERLIQKKVDFFPGQNFTQDPVALSGEEAVQKNNIAIIEKLLVEFVNPATKNVGSLSWIWRGSSEVNLLIYRAQEPIDSQEKLKKAELLVEIPAELQKFLDYTLYTGKPNYYALVARSESDKMQTKQDQPVLLIADQNYSTRALRTDSLPEMLLLNFDAKMVKTDEQNQCQAQLSWRYPKEMLSPKQWEVRIYRSMKTISSEADLQADMLVVEMNGAFQKYTDMPLDCSKPYYYALILGTGKPLTWFTKIDAKRNYLLVSKSSKQQAPVISQDPQDRTKKPSGSIASYTQIFSSLSAKPDARGVQILWRYQKQIPERYQKQWIYIIRTDEPPIDFETVRNHGVIVHEFLMSSGLEAFIDETPIERKVYYYVLLIGPGKSRVTPLEYRTGYNVYAQGVIPFLEKSNHNANGSLQKRDPKKKRMFTPAGQLDMVELNNILNDYYYQGQYSQSYRKLEIFINNANRIVKSKALLYQGRSLYKMERYRQALPYFLDRDVQELYQKEALFWQQAIYKKLR